MSWSEGIVDLMRQSGLRENTSPLYFGIVTAADPVSIRLCDGDVEVSEAMENLKISKLLKKGERYEARGSWNFEPVSDDTRVSEVDGWWESLKNYIQPGDTAILLTSDCQTFYLVGVT